MPKRRCQVIAENGTSHEEVEDLGTDQFGKSVERGYYGQALREGLVRKPSPQATRIEGMLLWVLNVVVGLLLMAFIGWRLYTLYFA